MLRIETSTPRLMARHPQRDQPRAEPGRDSCGDGAERVGEVDPLLRARRAAGLEVREGSVTLDGEDLLASRPHERAAKGMFLGFQ